MMLSYGTLEAMNGLQGYTQIITTAKSSMVPGEEILAGLQDNTEVVPSDSDTGSKDP